MIAAIRVPIRNAAATDPLANDGKRRKKPGREEGFGIRGHRVDKTICKRFFKSWVRSNFRQDTTESHLFPTLDRTFVGDLLHRYCLAAGCFMSSTTSKRSPDHPSPRPAPDFRAIHK